MATIAGIGIGLFILAVLWVLAIFLCLALSRAQGNISYAGFAAVLVAIVVTLVLGFFPRGPDGELEDVVIYDHTVVGRLTLVSLCTLMALVGFFVFFSDHLVSPREARPLKKIK